VIALGAELVRGTLDAGRTPAPVPSLSRILAPLRHVLRSPPLIELVVVAFIYAALQICLVSFLVVYLAESLRFSLVAAGLALTAATVGGVVGRILWGMVADFHIPPKRLLALIGIAAGSCSCATAAFGSAWPLAAIVGVCALFGLTAIGWNGVQLAEVARISPPDQVGSITGASNFVAFGGVVLGPPVFALVAALTDDYRYGFVVFGGAAIGCGVWLLARRQK
jgi:sugar phosphate permease